jgi:cyclohexadienyl dehydratase
MLTRPPARAPEGALRVQRARRLGLRWLALAWILCACKSTAPAGATARAAPPAQADQVDFATPPAASLLVLGTSADYPPFSARHGHGFEGFSIELMEQFARARGRSLSWLEFRWPELMPELERGTFVLASSGISVRPERSLRARYSVPVATTGSVLLVRVGTAPNELPGEPREALSSLDRVGLRVGVNQGGHLERVARSTFAQATVVTFPSNDLVPQAMARGEVELALTNTIEAPHWAALNPGARRVGPFTREYVALLLRAEQAELEDTLDDWLIAREADGSLGRLRQQFLGAEAQEQTASLLAAILSATAERLALMPWVAAAKQHARRPIEDLAQEARVLAAAIEEVSAAAAAEGLPAPAEPLVAAFVRAQMEAAKDVQRASLSQAKASELPLYSLDQELRPAIARVTHRMHRLLARLPRAGSQPSLELDALERECALHLEGTGIGRERSAELARSLFELARARN